MPLETPTLSVWGIFGLLLYVQKKQPTTTTSTTIKKKKKKSTTKRDNLEACCFLYQGKF